jgi:hypothetical protein
VLPWWGEGPWRRRWWRRVGEINGDELIVQARERRKEHKVGGLMLRDYRFGKHGLFINLKDGPKSMAVLKEIERHFGKDIAKLDAEVDACLIVSCSYILLLRMWMRLRS